MQSTIRRGFINNFVRVAVKKLDINNKKRGVIREERDNSRLQSMDNCSWEQLIERLTSMALRERKQFLISDFFRHLPPDIHLANNKKKMAEFVVDRIGEAKGFDFFYKQFYILSKKAKGLLSLFAGAQVYKFECSQNRRRTTKDSDIVEGELMRAV